MNHFDRALGSDRGKRPFHTLSENEIQRILRVASWDLQDMGTEVKGFEGGRSVILRREQTTYNIGIPEIGLQISGIGYLEMKKMDGGRSFFEWGDVMHPPTLENFYDHVDLEDFGTAIILPDGSIGTERPVYSPMGSYLESSAREKIEKTRMAGGLGLVLLKNSKIRTISSLLGS